MLLDLLESAYLSRSSDQNQSMLKNMYLEADEHKGKYKVIALPTAGLGVFKDTSLTGIRDMYVLNRTLYSVANNKLIRVASDLTQTELGTLNTSSGYAKIKAITGGIDTNNQLFVQDGTNCYSYNTGSSSGQFPITDEDCPQDSIDCANQDDYILVANRDSISFNICKLSDTLTWQSLDFASKIGEADPLEAILSHQKNLYLFGSESTEVWYNSGNVNFPFEPVGNTFLHYGCAAKGSVVRNNSYFIFLSSNGKGGYSVYQINPRISSYNPDCISDPYIDTLIGSFTTVSDARAYIYSLNGHEFYELTFPSEGYTLIYDIPKVQRQETSPGRWTIRQSGTSSTGRFIGNCQVFCYGKSLVGDYNSGIIYYQSKDLYTENGSPILREIVTPAGQTYAGGKRVIINNLQIDVETGIGSNKTFTLEKSIDNGSTWTLVNTYTVPDKGRRIYEPSLGSTKLGMIFRIRTTMDAKFILLGFQVEAKICH